MPNKPEANPPIVRGKTAVKDIGTAVDFILQRRNIPRLNLLGFSWGTTLMATYTTQNAQKVERLSCMRRFGSGRQPRWCRLVPGPLAFFGWLTANKPNSIRTTALPRRRTPRL